MSLLPLLPLLLNYKILIVKNVINTFITFITIKYQVSKMSLLPLLPLLPKYKITYVKNVIITFITFITKI